MSGKLFLLLALTFTCFGQSVSSVAGKDAAGPSDGGKISDEPDIQSATLDFKHSEPVQGVGASAAFVVPFQCTDDGAVFLDALSPAGTGRGRTFYSLHDKETQKFALSAIHDLRDVEIIDYFPAHSMVGFLVRAIQETAVSPGGAQASDGKSGATEMNRAVHHYFVAEFDRDGSYKKSVQLGLDYPLFRMAVLPSGEFLVTGYDSATDAETMVLLDDAGQVVRDIDQPLSAKERAARREASAYKRMLNGAQSAGRTNFVEYKDSILAWRAGTNDPVLEIGAGGETREVPIAVPQSSMLADMLPSDDQWIIHVNSANVSGDGPRDLSGYQYYEVSPLDGSLLRKLVIAQAAVGSIACKSKGKYVAFSKDKENKLVEFVAYDR